MWCLVVAYRDRYAAGPTTPCNAPTDWHCLKAAPGCRLVAHLTGVKQFVLLMLNPGWPPAVFIDKRAAPYGFSGRFWSTCRWLGAYIGSQ